MKTLVTGATGFIGYHVANLLRQKGLHVRALVRSEWDAAFLEDLGVELVPGDIRDLDTIYSALRGCSQVYHLAADFRLWVPDPKTMYEINVQGTRNVLYASLMLSIDKVVYTSTVDVLGVSGNGAPLAEDAAPDIKEMAGHYKTSKFIAEREVAGFVRKGLPVVIVNPATPVGAMDRKPSPTGRMIVDFLNNRISGYLDTVLNVVDVEDVAAGHVLAAERGKIGQRYILGNRSMTLKEFFKLLAAATGKHPPRIPLPYLPVLIAALVDTGISRCVPGRQPRIPLAGVRTAKHSIQYDCSKAVAELQVPRSPVEKAVYRAITWFEKNGYVKRSGKIRTSPG